MKDHFQIRLINSTTDAETVLEVYKPYILNTSITFEYEVPSVRDFEERINSVATEYPWLVCERNKEIIGYAYGCRHRYRTAYNWSVESTIYLATDFHGKGLGRVLYNTLFSILKLQGFINVYAGVGMPNIKSEALHQAMGFEVIGDFTKIGYKLGEWHDVRWFQKHLSEHGTAPSAPKFMVEIEHSEGFRAVMAKANQSIKSNS